MSETSLYDRDIHEKPIFIKKITILKNIKRWRTSAVKPTRAVVIRTEFESLITLTLIGTQGVDTSAVVAYIRISLALVDVDAIVSVAGQREPSMTDALKATLQVATRAVAANPWSLVTLIDVDAISLAGTKFVTSRTHALEVALLINTLSVSATGIRYLKKWHINILLMSIIRYYQENIYRQILLYFTIILQYCFEISRRKEKLKISFRN